VKRKNSWKFKIGEKTWSTFLSTTFPLTNHKYFFLVSFNCIGPAYPRSLRPYFIKMEANWSYFENGSRVESTRKNQNNRTGSVVSTSPIDCRSTGKVDIRWDGEITTKKVSIKSLKFHIEASDDEDLLSSFPHTKSLTKRPRFNANITRDVRKLTFRSESIHICLCTSSRCKHYNHHKTTPISTTKCHA
jgi:hypothetical protein